MEKGIMQKEVNNDMETGVWRFTGTGNWQRENR